MLIEDMFAREMSLIPEEAVDDSVLTDGRQVEIVTPEGLHTGDGNPRHTGQIGQSDELESNADTRETSSDDDDDEDEDRERSEES
jgi:hypothetical protein